MLIYLFTKFLPHFIFKGIQLNSLFKRINDRLTSLQPNLLKSCPQLHGTLLHGSTVHGYFRYGLLQPWSSDGRGSLGAWNLYTESTDVTTLIIWSSFGNRKQKWNGIWNDFGMTYKVIPMLLLLGSKPHWAQRGLLPGKCAQDCSPRHHLKNVWLELCVLWI